MTIWRFTVLFVGGVSAAIGVVIFNAPQAFYDAVPGLDLMGPYNVHFIRDVSLAYLASGAMLIAGGVLLDRRLALAGTLWFVLHALFHWQIWLHRGLPFDYIFWFDLFAVIIPSFLALLASLRLLPNEILD
ncbi:MAG TPA: hypothetical protein PLR76_00165 [Hyphomonas sp.]|jgi:hypothetical protein|nr:hypothetical protein [Hyphomonas sp.]MCC0017759.1 hypothetical protein [Rhodobiaceae bacterium]HPE46771.1 hypothetical protein [Hyphomonas sp.]